MSQLDTKASYYTRRDEYGQEMSPNAMIWQEYTVEADTHDQQLLNQWNQNIDTMLIVATLFSAVVTAFVVLTVENLGPSAQDLTNSLLLDIAQSLRVPQTSTTQPNDDQMAFVVSPTNLWVNGLWFVSLACSLGAAAIGMLIKQWLNAYSAGLPSAHQVRARMRQHRYDALIKWKTPEIIGFLPFAISMCIMLFLLGLSIWLFSLNETVAIASTICIVCIVLFHIASFLLPAVCKSPWKTAISPLVYQSLYPFRRFSNSLILQHSWGRLKSFIAMSILAAIQEATLIINAGLRLLHSLYRDLLKSLLRSIYIYVMHGLEVLWRALISLFKTVNGHAQSWLKIPLHILMFPLLWICKMIFKGISYAFQKTLAPIYEYYSSRYILVYPSYLPTSVTIGRHIKQIGLSFSQSSHPHLKLSLWKLHDSKYDDDEVKYIQDSQLTTHWLDGQALLWMICTSTRSSVVEHSVQSLAGLSPAFDDLNILENLLQPVQKKLMMCLSARDLHFIHIELYARALWQIQSNLTIRTGGHGRGSENANQIETYVRMNMTFLQKERSAFAACISACRMLNEITELLCVICEESSLDRSPPIYTRILVETLTQEMSRRKRIDISMWSFSRSDNSLESRVVPLLVKLLRVRKVSLGLHEYDGPGPFDTSLAVSLAIFTQALPNLDLATAYASEEHRMKDLQYLICASLSMILRFPSHFNCQEIIEVVYKKFISAGIELLDQPHQDNTHYHVITAEVFKAAFSPQKQLNHTLAIALTKMDPRAYLHLQPTAISDPNKYFTENLPMEVQIAVRIVLENLQTPFALLPYNRSSGQDHELIDIVLSSKLEISSRTRAFQLLLKRAYESRDNKIRRKQLKDQGFFDAVRVFFYSLGSLDQRELSHWLKTLSVLCKHDAKDLVKSGAMEAFISWAYQDWRGRPMMSNQMEVLRELATSVSLNVEDINDTSWFVPQQESASKYHIPRAI